MSLDDFVENKTEELTQEDNAFFESSDNSQIIQAFITRYGIEPKILIGERKTNTEVHIAITPPNLRAKGFKMRSPVMNDLVTLQCKPKTCNTLDGVNKELDMTYFESLLWLSKVGSKIYQYKTGFLYIMRW